MSNKSGGNKNLIIGALIVVILGIGFYLYQDSQKDSVSIEFSRRRR